MEGLVEHLMKVGFFLQHFTGSEVFDPVFPATVVLYDSNELAGFTRYLSNSTESQLPVDLLFENLDPGCRLYFFPTVGLCRGLNTAEENCQKQERAGQGKRQHYKKLFSLFPLGQAKASVDSGVSDFSYSNVLPVLVEGLSGIEGVSTG